ncbi:cytochrome P450 family protein [Nocardia ignorata]|uniref:Cytochrome P450 n=1 Tax=Nocardia ignorata TaxID=145285 RepID=A0A4R6PJ93_NOCIG|nr:cytochrome P450 [Nocardia ignorata]TDP37673.1 cytochrome P450 [Nocardia ignorata]
MTADSIHRLTEDFYRNPQDTYRVLNEHGRVHHVQLPNGLRAWMVTGYDLAKQVLSDPTISKDLYGPAGTLAQLNANIPLRLDPPVNDNLVYSDPPRHTRLRKIAMRALTGRAIREFDSKIPQIAESILESVGTAAEVDILSAYAYPFTVTVVCELIGIDPADRGEFQGWLQTQLSAAGTPEKYAAAASFEKYVYRLMDLRDGRPATDFLSDLMRPPDDGERLERRELVAMVNALLLGGQETTAALIGNSILTMLRRPGLMQELRADPGIVPAFIEEMLRYESSGNVSPPRFTTAPIEIGGQKIDSGQVVVVSLASANRDPNKFERPDELEPNRLDNRHLAFGYGIHRCAGAALARREAQVAVSSLLAHYSDISAATDLETLRWQSSSITHGLVSLPVRVKI